MVPTEICQAVLPPEASACAFRGKAFLGELVPDYLVAVPQDPEDTDSWGTGYEIWRDSDGRIHLDAPRYNNSKGLTLAK